jgi:hypothetical protein
MVPAFTVKLTKVEPCGTVTELPGSGKSVLLLESDISVPPEGAAPLNSTVQLVVASEVKVVGVQEIWETDTICAMVACAESKRIRTEIRALLCPDCFRMSISFNPRFPFGLPSMVQSTSIRHVLIPQPTTFFARRAVASPNATFGLFQSFKVDKSHLFHDFHACTSVSPGLLGPIFAGKSRLSRPHR